MKTYCLILFVLLLCVKMTAVYAQDTAVGQGTEVPSAFYKTVSGRSERLQGQLDQQSAKALRRYRKYEKSMLKKLYKVDSVAAVNFSIVSAQKYNELQSRLSKAGPLTKYIPALDTLTTSLQFLQHVQIPGSDNKELHKALENVQSLAGRLKKGEDVKQYLKEQKEYIKDQLERFKLSGELKKINKNLYYYSEELQEIKASFQDQDKLERKVIALLNRTKFFQQFIQKNGMLAGLFATGDAQNGPATIDIAGLQSRTGINEVIQRQLSAGGPNAQEVFRTSVQQGQAQLQQLKNKLNEQGAQGSEAIMPEGFIPNTQRAKSFFKRLEVYANMQSQRANSYFPVSTEFGLGVGYRLSGNFIAGIGASHKMGWGDNIRHISVTHQGIGLRSYIDWKFPAGFLGIKNTKGTWWISGGYERNYSSTIKKWDELKNYSAWQASGLIGISKKMSVGTKFLKGTRLQLLWDFLSYTQVPRSNPFVFRIGYSIR